MKTTSKTIVWGAVAAMSLMPVFSLMRAQTTNTNAASTSPGAGMSQQPLSAERANQILRKDIQNSQGQTIGKINNFVVDLESGRILYGIVNVSGLPGGNQVVLPPNQFGLGTNGTNLIVKVDDKMSLTNAPRWSATQAPEMGNVSFVRGVYQHFGQQPWWEGGPTPTSRDTFGNVHPVGKLVGTKLQTSSNTNLGTIKDIALDVPNGRVLYVILSPAGDLGSNNTVYPLPPMVITKGPDAKTLVTGVDSSKLQGAPHFTNDNWPNVADPAFAAQVYQYYGKQPYFQTGGGMLSPTGRPGASGGTNQ
ncbi:MAG: photosystem reaction center subunit [Pedosphaera sp.]|nr:photosystem reaction center subunit [Pedosphaera sp.]